MASESNTGSSYDFGDTKNVFIQDTGDTRVLSAQDEEPAIENDIHDVFEGIHGDTSNDIKDMLRLGKKQEFKRNFSLSRLWDSYPFI